MLAHAFMHRSLCAFASFTSFHWSLTQRVAFLAFLCIGKPPMCARGRLCSQSRPRQGDFRCCLGCFARDILALGPRHLSAMKLTNVNGVAGKHTRMVCRLRNSHRKASARRCILVSAERTHQRQSTPAEGSARAHATAARSARLAVLQRSVLTVAVLSAAVAVPGIAWAEEGLPPGLVDQFEGWLVCSTPQIAGRHLLSRGIIIRLARPL